jgi:putative oxidoreductase
MSLSETLAPLIGRFAFGWFFLMQVMVYGGDWDGTITLMAFHGVPAAAFLLVVTLLLLTMGALSLIFGFHARYGALILFFLTLTAMVVLHDWWRITGNPSLRGVEFELFACHAAIAGGLLMLIGMGPGPLAIDNKAGGNRGGGKR